MPSKGSIDAFDGSAGSSQPDTSRLQSAIDNCPSGQAVKLVAGSTGESGFLTGPLTLKSGVTLWIDSGVTLFASRSPRDYDNGVGTCGTATSSSTKSCNPLIHASSTVNSGIVGDGIIDGRGGSLLTSGAHAGSMTWWDVAYLNKTQGLNQQNPRLLQVDGGSGFTLYRITLQNSPNFHVVTSGLSGATSSDSGFVAWGVKVLSPSLVYTQANYACASGTTPDVLTPATCFTPDTVKNTDGIDPGTSSNVLIAYSYISTGDDHIAIKSGGSPGVKNVTVAHNHFYYGHGMSIGSETNGSVSSVAVTDLSIDGYDSGNGNGLRIKSDASRGGLVTGITYQDVCVRNLRKPLLFDPFYSSSTGSEYPDFTNITISGFHDTGSSKYGGGTLTFTGYELSGQNNPLNITLDNVVFDGSQPGFASAANGGPASPGAVNFTLGPGPVSFASSLSASPTVTITDSRNGSAAAVDCSSAFPTLQSVLATSPI